MTESQQTTIAPEQVSKLRQLLMEELSHARLLHHRLSCERELLKTPDPAGLQEMARRKSASLQHLSQLANKRLQWMQQHKLPLADEFLQHPSIMHSSTLVELWQQLATWYEKNRQLSQILSEIVLTNRLRVQKRLQILQGKKDQTTLLYNKQGHSQQGGGKNGYISA